MLIAEDLLLLLTDESSGRHLVDGNVLDVGLAGAVLLELAMMGTADIAGAGEQVRRGRVVMRSTAPTSDPVLDEAVQRIVATGPRKPQALLPVLMKGLRPVLLARLMERGILRAQEKQVWGIFPVRSWPAVDSEHEEHLRAGLHEVLVLDRKATPYQIALVSMLSATGALTKVVGGAPAREVKRRAKTVAEGEFVGVAVREAIQAVNAAVMVVVSADAGGGDGS